MNRRSLAIALAAACVALSARSAAPAFETLHFAGPWGQGFPEPLFDNEFALLQRRVLKDKHLKLTLRQAT